MRVPNDHPLARTYALLDADDAPAAAESLRGLSEPAAVEGLVELLLNRDTSATAASAALRALESDSSPLVWDAVVRSLNAPHPSVRILAVQEVARRGLVADARTALFGLLNRDTFWQVRRAAVNALAVTSLDGTDLLGAWNDPHWRVRYALAQVLEAKGRDPDVRASIQERFPAVLHNPRALRLRDYLAYRWTGELPPERPAPDPQSWCPFWDWDAAVLARNLETLDREGRRAALDVLVRLVTHPDERVRAWVVRAVRDDGTAGHWTAAITLCRRDPREGAEPLLDDLTRGVSLDWIEEVAKYILAGDEFHPLAVQWAFAQVGEVFPAEDVLADLERLSEYLPEPSDNAVSPFAPDHPFARAAALTPERAKELVANPTLETSWFVLARAARMCRVPIWNIAPEATPRAPAKPQAAEQPLVLPEIALVRPRQIGVGGPVVTPLGVSGHYGLQVEGYTRAAEQGVNLFFWEPNYATLTRFVTRLSPNDRRGVHVLAGTFEADPAKVRKDAERALRNLKLERLSVFLIFWTQSWQRVTPDVRDELERLKRDGLVQVFGLSTHNRAIARDAIADGWNPVMVRHSAAHRKAEVEVFPLRASAELRSLPSTTPVTGGCSTRRFGRAIASATRSTRRA